MNIRREPTYLSTDVWRALLVISKARNDKPRSTSGEGWSPDFIADEILRETLQSKYPQLFEHQKQIDKMEKDLIKTLGET